MHAEDFPLSGVRRLIAGDYLLHYEVVGGEARILSIRHGRQAPAPMADDNFNFEDPPQR